MSRPVLLDDLPLVLAGPILRRVEASGVTVQLALQRPGEVALRVHRLTPSGSAAAVVQQSVRSTISLGDRLHVVAVTSMGEDLDPGTLYGYDVTIRDAAGTSHALFDDGVVSAVGENARGMLCYRAEGAPALPSFATAPDSVDRLRVLHGSCRCPHGQGPDLLAAVDGIVAASVGDPATRPHHLFLTGDQIYADNVADVLLDTLSAAGELLLGRVEHLPGVEVPARVVPAGKRSAAVREHAGFAGEEHVTKSHLLTFGEFCAMYLFAWSDTLWPATLPHSDAPHAELEEKGLRAFRHGLSRVRRALANVPVLTMWDDHEVTDGWFISLAWAERSLGSRLGRRVLTDALAAFAVFQAWGNTPDRFTPNQPGGDLLAALEQWDGTADGETAQRIERLVGIPDVESGSARLAPPPGAVDWSYTLTGPAHDVLVLDTRTRRGYFPDDHQRSPGLLSEQDLDAVIGRLDGGNRERLLLLVSPAPLFHVPVARAERADLDMFTADRELWENEADALRGLLDRLAGIRSRVVVLCGDVHLGYTARLHAQAHDSPEVATLIQATSSPLKNETPAKRRFHTEGYELVRGDVLAEPIEIDGGRFAHRVEWLLAADDAERTAGVAPKASPYPPPGPERDAALAAYLSGPVEGEGYRGPWGDGKEIVGVNNLGEVTFLGPGPDHVVHELWWYLEGADAPFPLTRWEVPLQ